MPVLLSILGVLAVAAFWCYRIQASSRLTDESVRAIEDPAVAAAALLIALASRGGPMGPAAQSAIRNEMRDVMAMPKVEESFNFARRVANHVKDPSDLVWRFSGLWMDRLRPFERAELYDMASRVAEAYGGPTDEQAGCLRLLSERLGLTRP